MLRADASRTGSPWGGRLPFLAGTGYVAILAIVSDGAREPGAWVAATVAVVLGSVVVVRASGSPRWIGWGASLVIPSFGVDRPGRALVSCAAVGLLAALSAALVAMARVPPDGGVVRTEPRSPRGEVAAVVVAWWLAVAAAMAPKGRVPPEVAASAAVWAWFAVVVSAVALAFSCWRPLRRRRLELGAVERAQAAASLLSTLMVAAVFVAIVGPARPDAVARAALLLGAIALASCALSRDAVRVARVARRLVTLALFGGTVALLGATAVEGRVGGSWTVSMITALAALALGALAARLEGPLRPAGGVWLEAFHQASAVAALHPDPLDAIRATLLALRAPLGLGVSPVELWTLSPQRVITVDAAGYLHEREAAMPGELVPIAGAEPDGSIRAEVLEALEVRRPDLRASATWLSDRSAQVATVVAAEGEPEGLLVVPRGSRAERLTLEEVRALKAVADRLATACRARSTEARMLARVNEATARAEAAEGELERLQHERALEEGRHAIASARLARSAMLGTYSAASRMPLDAIERRAAATAPIVVVAPTGVDPVPYLARGHLAGPRAGGPFVVVDGAESADHDAQSWSDPARSPLALAEGGTLALLDGAALPLEVQQLIARVLAENRVPWERADRFELRLTWASAEAPEALLEAGRLDPALAVRFGDACAAPIVLPRLRDRPEDLRAILMDRLARESLRALGRPVGIEPSAYARLAEYPFPGEDAELAAVVVRLVSVCRGDIVTAPDVDTVLGEGSPARDTDVPPASSRSNRARDANAAERSKRVTGTTTVATAMTQDDDTSQGGQGAKRRKDPISA